MVCENGGHPVSDKCLEMLGAPIEPGKNNGTVTPHMHINKRAFLTEDYSLANSVALHISKRGMVSCFKGATLVFAITKAQVGG